MARKGTAAKPKPTPASKPVVEKHEKRPDPTRAKLLAPVLQKTGVASGGILVAKNTQHISSTIVSILEQ